MDVGIAYPGVATRKTPERKKAPNARFDQESVVTTMSLTNNVYYIILQVLERATGSATYNFIRSKYTIKASPFEIFLPDQKRPFRDILLTFCMVRR